MFQPRVIPVLLLKNRGLYKTCQFKNPTYIGDPINTVRIFNDKEVDEIILLDITATKENRPPDFGQITDIISESFMPLGYGGGISTYDQAMQLLSLGVEKLVLNSHALANPALITKIAESAGSQAVVVAVDVRKPLLGTARVYAAGREKTYNYTAVEWAKEAVNHGAGEIMITSIAHEGTMKGYDLELIKTVANAVSVPVVAHGGAGSFSDLQAGLNAGASAVAAGSFFVFQGPHRAVLISYPSQSELLSLTGKQT